MKFTFVIIFFAATQFLSPIRSLDTGSHSVAGDPYVQGMRVNKMIKHVVTSEAAEPKVEIIKPDKRQPITWGAQVRYVIDVTDEVDGSSKYGEINATECLLEIEFLSAAKATDAEEIIKQSKSKPEHPGLSLIKTSTCFGCHADKITLAGPSFSDIAKRYGNQAGSNKFLGKRIIEGSSGIWGTSEMPSHPDITTEGADQIANYILEQGAKKNSWIYPGFEGTFRIIDKPSTDTKSVYRLTASYTSKAKQRGQHSIILEVR